MSRRCVSRKPTTAGTYLLYIMSSLGIVLNPSTFHCRMLISRSLWDDFGLGGVPSLLPSSCFVWGLLLRFMGWCLFGWVLIVC